MFKKGTAIGDYAEVNMEESIYISTDIQLEIVERVTPTNYCCK